MQIELYGDPLKDEVLGAVYLVGKTDYQFSIERLYPLIQSLDIQRDVQNPSFYLRLRNDLKLGCVVPPITIAFITEVPLSSVDSEFINSNIGSGFILDGIQRLNAIRQAFDEVEGDQEKTKYLRRTLHLNIIVSPSMDRLLYRMITLNNGQKPMSPRHQIDILSKTIFDFDSLTLKNQSHKDRQRATNKLAVHRSDVVKGYIAYLSNTSAIDNKLIIEEKMDSLIAERIIESDMSKEKYEFMDVLHWVANTCQLKEVNKWFVVGNNFIGFCVAARNNFEYIRQVSPEDFELQIDRFESVFANFDKRKIRVGDYRRKMVADYFGSLERFSAAPESDVILELSAR